VLRLFCESKTNGGEAIHVASDAHLLFLSHKRATISSVISRGLVMSSTQLRGKDEYFSVRVDAALKKEATQVFDSLGVSASDAFRQILKQIVEVRQIAPVSPRLLKSLSKPAVRRAAALEGGDVERFAIAAVNETAGRVLERHALIELSLKDQTTFLNALQNPPAPGAALKKAAKRHRELLGD
jgi:addiction module RelB/DinJ family antitoxin